MFFPSRLARRGANPRAALDTQIMAPILELAGQGALLVEEAGKVQDKIDKLIASTVDYEDTDDAEKQVQAIWHEYGLL